MTAIAPESEPLIPTPKSLVMLRLLLIRFKLDCEIANFWPDRQLTGIWHTPEEWAEPDIDSVAQHHPRMDALLEHLLTIAWQIHQLHKSSSDSNGEITSRQRWGSFWDGWIITLKTRLKAAVTAQANIWGVDDLHLGWGENEQLVSTTELDKTDWFYDILELWIKNMPTSSVVRQDVADSVEIAIAGLTEILAAQNRGMPHPFLPDVDDSQFEDIENPRQPGRKPDKDRPAMIAMMEDLLSKKRSWDEITQIINKQFGKRCGKHTLRGYCYQDRRERLQTGGSKGTRSD